MLLSKALTPDLIKLNVESETKEELFEEMVQVLVSAGLVTDREGAVSALLEREAMMSTGIGHGFALPHGKIPGIKGCILALAIIRNGMEFDSMDGEPVYVAIVLLSEMGNPTQHLETLTEISRLFNGADFVQTLLTARTPEQVIKMIAELE